MKGALLVVAVLLSGCYGLPTEPRPPNGVCPFPPGTHFAFIGRASASELGFPTPDWHVGQWWVSSERLQYAGHGLPGPPGRPERPIPPPSPLACGLFDDGSIAYLNLPLDWHVPFDASSS